MPPLSTHWTHRTLSGTERHQARKLRVRKFSETGTVNFLTISFLAFILRVRILPQNVGLLVH
jgi:hypothetical protein